MKENKTFQEKPVRGELLTIDEAAKYIHIGKSTLYECIDDGIFTVFRPPRGKRLIDSADLDDWLKMAKIPAGTVSK